MSKTIIQLFNGELEPARYWGMATAEIKDLESLIQKNYEKLAVCLNDGEKKVLEKYCDAVNEYIDILCEKNFRNGFSFGARLISEALTDTEGQISQ